MSTVLKAIVGPNTYNLSDGSISWRIVDDGLAMAPVRRLEERGPLQHGATDVGFRLDPRIIHLTLKTQGTSMADLNNRRKTLINIFKPLASTPTSLRYELDNGDIRQIDCYLAGGLQMDGKDRQGFLQACAVTLKAPDPCFYNPVQDSIVYGVSAGGSSLNVPLVVPVVVGSSVVNQVRAVNYSGTFPVNPVILITGPIQNPVITNLTTNEKLSLTGYTIPSGSTYTIDTRYGYKTVKDQLGVNQIAKLSNDSTLATFHLDVDPVAPNGNNNIQVTGLGATAATQIYIQFYTKFVGL